jgi:hypothetical protein
MGAKTTQGSERGTLADQDTKSSENCGFLGCVLDQVLMTIHQETIKIAIGNSSTIQTRKNLKTNAEREPKWRQNLIKNAYSIEKLI